MTEKKHKSDSSFIVPKDGLLQNILGHIADPVFVKDKNHQWIYGNQAFSDIMGVPAEKYLGKSDYDFFPREEADVFWATDDAVFNSEHPTINEESLTDPQGNRHIISTKKAKFLLSTGEPVLVGIIRDITAIKEIDRLKDEFISMVSHELRTPLTSIRASLELLAAGKVGVLPSDVQRLLQIACRNSGRLEDIINEILDFEKLGAGKISLQIKPLPIAGFLEQALDENRTYGQKYGVSFKLAEAPAGIAVMADANKLMQVLANLLSNAAKFSPVNSTVHVRAIARGENRICLQVQDTGRGIPEKFREHIFDRFAQADSSNTRQHQGTGLGLYITKKLVEAMDGDITFESVEGRQTTFFVDLPACAVAQETARQAV